MLSGFAFLDRLDENYINEQARKRRLVEVESEECTGCGVKFRVFAGPDLPKDDAEANSDVKDLKERAHQFIHRDCPAIVPEGQPRKGSHSGKFELLEDGRAAF